MRLKPQLPFGILAEYIRGQLAAKLHIVANTLVEAAQAFIDGVLSLLGIGLLFNTDGSLALHVEHPLPPKEGKHSPPTASADQTWGWGQDRLAGPACDHSTA